MQARYRVLFLCTGNSCRSQMAEGWTRHLKGDQIDVRSAGITAKRLDPRAVQVMAEVGIDISGHRSKCLDEFLDVPFDYVITVCDNANESCPVFPGPAKRVHWSFDDPAEATGSDAEILAEFCRVRDQIRAKLTEFAAAE